MTVNPLSGDINLRNTSEWPVFDTVETLKHGYGTIKIKPVKYDATGKKWFLLDHEIIQVLGVRVNRSNYTAFEPLNDTDYNDKPASFITTNDNLTGRLIEIELEGKIHPVTGGLMRNPADIIWDIKNLDPDSTFQESDIDLFRRDCQEFGIEIDGVLDSHLSSTQSYFANIALSTGSIFGGALANIFRIFPRNTIPDGEFISARLDKTNMYNVNAPTESSELFTILRINYAYNQATGKFDENLQLEAKEEVKKFRLTKTINLKWIKDGRLAWQIGERWLQYWARKKYNISFECNLDLNSGEYIEVNHPYIFGGLNQYMIVPLSKKTETSGGTYGIIVPVGLIPEIIITQQSETFTI